MKIDARGKQCPLPVIDTKNALNEVSPGEVIEVLVDNEIAVQNLQKLAGQKKLNFASQKTGEREYLVKILQASADVLSAETGMETKKQCCVRQGVVAVVPSDAMGSGDDTLGRLLMKGFIYALSKQDFPLEAILLYNGGAKLSCEGSESLEDLKALEAQGTEIITCGTCLSFYGLGEKLAVGSVTNMYDIADTLIRATLIVRP